MLRTLLLCRVIIFRRQFYAADDDVLDTLTREIQNWSKRKEQLFKRNYLSAAYHYLKGQVELAPAPDGVK